MRMETSGVRAILVAVLAVVPLQPVAVRDPVEPRANVNALVARPHVGPPVPLDVGGPGLAAPAEVPLLDAKEEKPFGDLLKRTVQSRVAPFALEKGLPSQLCHLADLFGDLAASASEWEEKTRRVALSLVRAFPMYFEAGLMRQRTKLERQLWAAVKNDLIEMSGRPVAGSTGFKLFQKSPQRVDLVAHEEIGEVKALSTTLLLMMSDGLSDREFRQAFKAWQDLNPADLEKVADLFSELDEQERSKVPLTEQDSKKTAPVGDKRGFAPWAFLFGHGRKEQETKSPTLWTFWRDFCLAPPLREDLLAKALAESFEVPYVDRLRAPVPLVLQFHIWEHVTDTIMAPRRFARMEDGGTPGQVMIRIRAAQALRTCADDLRAQIAPRERERWVKAQTRKIAKMLRGKDGFFQESPAEMLELLGLRTELEVDIGPLMPSLETLLDQTLDLQSRREAVKEMFQHIPRMLSTRRDDIRGSVDWRFLQSNLLRFANSMFLEPFSEGFKQGAGEITASVATLLLSISDTMDEKTFSQVAAVWRKLDAESLRGALELLSDLPQQEEDSEPQELVAVRQLLRYRAADLDAAAEAAEAAAAEAAKAGIPVADLAGSDMRAGSTVAPTASELDADAAAQGSGSDSREPRPASSDAALESSLFSEYLPQHLQDRIAVLSLSPAFFPHRLRCSVFSTTLRQFWIPKSAKNANRVWSATFMKQFVHRLPEAKKELPRWFRRWVRSEHKELKVLLQTCDDLRFYERELLDVVRMDLSKAAL